MAVKLDDATQVAQRESDPLRVIETATHTASGRVLAVCETSSGTLVLARERTVGVKVGEKRDRKAGTEQVLRRTAELADFAYALDLGLIE
jgi:hypothetical protein